MSRLLWLAIGGEGALALAGVVWARAAGYPLEPGPLGPSLAVGVSSGCLLAALQLWLLTRGPDLAPVRALRGLYRDTLRPLFARVTPAEILTISVMAGLGEEVLFRGAVQAAFGPIAASLLFGLCHVGGRATLVLGLWAALMGGILGGIAVATGGLLAPIVTHALYDALALSYIRWGGGVGETSAPDLVDAPAPDVPRKHG